MTTLRGHLVDQYDEHYRQINETLALTPALAQHLERTLAPVMAEVPAAACVLDLGCGSGLLLDWLARRGDLELHGVDAAAGQCTAARATVPAATVTCDDGLAYLEANPGRFDAVFCFDVIEHVADDLLLRWIRGARGALRPGGWLVYRVPNAANLTASYSRYIDLTHERLFTSTSMRQLLTAAGGLAEPVILPVRGGHLGARARLLAEQLVHRAVFRLCGRSVERSFATNLYVATRRI
jgi:2-polyprenyl-3-methyl-5-hydroxy-6-metoxy-1,4-benzoquinol methylase